MSFAKNMSKDVSSKYSQKLLGSDKKSTTDVIKTASKRAIQKTAEATGDLIDLMMLIMKKKHRKKKMHISRRKTTNYWRIKISITI